jgi:hypothetical protein
MAPPSSKLPSGWLARSRFLSDRKRNAEVREQLSVLFSDRLDTSARIPPQLDTEAAAVLGLLVAPLREDPPAASQAAEAALTLAAFSLAEGRVLNLANPAERDLLNNRIEGDRAVSDDLCRQILAPRNIPSTQGPLQSSSFRGGYLAEQVRNDGIRRYVAWQSAPGRSLRDVSEMATALVDEFLDKASAMPPMPTLVAARFTFITYRQARERLLEKGSGGALEQYLLAGLLDQEIPQSQPGARITTKSVGASDRAAGAGGDIEVRYGQALRGAIEVSAAEWDTKIDQLHTAASAGLSDATIAAVGVTRDVSAQDLAERLRPVAERLGLDVSVLDLHTFMDVAASRLTAYARSEAFVYVYRCLSRWHRRQPELAHRLIDTLSSLDLIAEDKSG